MSWHLGLNPLDLKLEDVHQRSARMLFLFAEKMEIQAFGNLLGKVEADWRIRWIRWHF